MIDNDGIDGDGVSDDGIDETQAEKISLLQNAFNFGPLERLELDLTSADDVYVAQESDAENFIIRALSGNDTVHGASGTDQLYGSAGNDKLYGYGGNDKLYGGSGDDLLKGNAGNDTLSGGKGSDILIGDGGSDMFRFISGTAFEGRDVIRDFSLAQGDVINLMDMLDIYASDPFANQITDFIRITDNGPDSFLAVDLNGGADEFVVIAELRNVTGLTDEEALVQSGSLIFG